MSQGVGLASCLPKTAWPPTLKKYSQLEFLDEGYMTFTVWGKKAIEIDKELMFKKKLINFKEDEGYTLDDEYCEYWIYTEKLIDLSEELFTIKTYMNMDYCKTEYMKFIFKYDFVEKYLYN